MLEITDTIIKSATLLLVGISTGLAVIIYYKSKRTELENSLFKSRLEAIGNLQMELTVFLQQIDKFKVILRHIEKYDENKRFEMSFEFDEQIYKCEASIVKYAAYFSDKTAKILIDFANNFYEMHKDITAELSDGLNMYEEYLVKNANEVIVHLRNEAGIEEIHQSLLKRFKKNRS